MRHTCITDDGGTALRRCEACDMEKDYPGNPSRTDASIHSWFELSYARYLTIPRSVLQSMPLEWQDRFTKCLSDLDETLPSWRPSKGRYYVQLRCEGKFRKDPLCEYRHAPAFTDADIKVLRQDSRT